MTAAELARRAAGLGLDVVGAAPAEAYDETEAHILERRERGLFADMRFTMAQPEVSCHPELLLDGEARTVVSAALCYWVDGPEPELGEGRLPRYAWRDHYALLRERLDALGGSLGGRYRVLVDENQHVDREGARRAGVGFYGKNTMLITREHGSWVVLGTLVTDVEIEPTPPLELDCGRCTLCIDACPTGALDEPGVLDSTRCLSYLDAGSRAGPGGVPLGARRIRLRLRHLPGRLSLEPRGREAPQGDALPPESVPNVSARRLADPGRRRARPRPRPALRAPQRSSLAAPERAARRRQLGLGGAAPLVEQWASSDDDVLGDAARWASARLGVVLNHAHDVDPLRCSPTSCGARSRR